MTSVSNLLLTLLMNPAVILTLGALVTLRTPIVVRKWVSLGVIGLSA